MNLSGTLAGVWHYLVLALTVILALLAAGHAVLKKRDPRSAVLWVGLIGLVPLVGAVLYFIIGVNRIRRRAASLRGKLDKPPDAPAGELPVPDELHLPSSAAHLVELVRVVNRVSVRPLVGGNRVEPLVDGDETYPAMLAAIESARHSLSLSTYIFDRGRMGGRFVEALGAAVQRGVQVRVLIDDTGARYSWPSIVSQLRRARVPVALFHPTNVPFRLLAINLRTHRKILVADGRIGFTGGINIRDGHQLSLHPRRPVHDLHFRVTGPVVAQLQQVFAEDWQFCTGETLAGDAWFPPLEPDGPVLARGISDGPDEDLDKLRWTLLGALACARRSVRIMTPYFLPDQGLVSALSVAALRGVEVDIVLPARNNLPFVQWAAWAQLWQVLERGCRVWVTPPPFDHSKLMLVDGVWSLVGSANWDPRSLRLNFEFNLECYHRELAATLDAFLQKRLKPARLVTLAEVDARPLPVKLRDGVARLFSPYL